MANPRNLIPFVAVHVHAIRRQIARRIEPRQPPVDADAPQVVVAGIVARADAARDARNYTAAAALYRAALDVAPGDAAIQVQCGHMLKESGAYADAELHYLAAERLTPDDPDLALQFGHFYRVTGRKRDAASAYGRALELKPGWDAARREIASLELPDLSIQSISPNRMSHLDVDTLVPELFPTLSQSPRPSPCDGVQISRLGRKRERTAWGMLTTLRGIEAIRGLCVSCEPIDTLEITIDGARVHSEPLQGSSSPGNSPGQQSYTFNAWIDFSEQPFRPVKIGLGFLSRGIQIHDHQEYVMIAAPLSETEVPGSDAIITLQPADQRLSLEARINARPSMVRPARRALIDGPIRNVLVKRTDQLGDMVASVPALRRIRDLFPQARIVGLLTAANAPFARTLGLFDEIVVADFPSDPIEGRRVMAPQAQAALKAQLAPYAFDIAIDLVETSASRPLLLLSGARFFYGFHDRDWPWMNAGMSSATHDRANHHEAAAHSTRLSAAIEVLGAMLNSRAEITHRPELDPRLLTPYGLGTGEPYVIVHSGGTIAHTQWPHYAELAAQILTRTDLRIVLITDDPGLRTRLSPDLLASPRLQLLDRRLPFDDFDALLSFCAAFVGNDSGPKHLASLRGAPVVSLHSARVNWSEWGQELTGSIISRRVPCAGCGIVPGLEECGKDFACITHITVAEVFEALTNLIEKGRDAA